MHLKLKRNHTGKHGTFGVLMEHDQPPFAVTLEPQWLDNLPNKSCIPAGTYICRPVTSPRFGKTWEVIDVEGRTHILFHKGNTASINHSNTLGCILVAEKYEPVNAMPGVFEEMPGVLSSADGFTEFLELVDGLNEFTLTITEDYYKESSCEQ